MRKYTEQIVLPLMLLALTMAIFFKLNEVRDDLKKSNNSMYQFVDR
jgi:hypothetical protein